MGESMTAVQECLHWGRHLC